jgi:hypothetical protein
MLLYLKSLGALSGAIFFSQDDNTTVKMTYDEWVEEGRPTSVLLSFVRD